MENEKIRNMQMSKIPKEEGMERQDPDLPDSVFSEKEKRDKMRTIRAKIIAAGKSML